MKVPFTYAGLRGTDRWIALDPMLDRATVEYRMRLLDQARDADSGWVSRRDACRAISDSLFSVPSDFNASDYFLSELALIGVGPLKHWRSLRRPEGNFLTVYQIDPERIGNSQSQGR